jgi:hypothetical protein
MRASSASSAVLRSLGLLLIGILLYESAVEFYNVALGTGGWLGGFSLKWGVAFFAFALFCLLCLLAAALALWQPVRLHLLANALVGWRNRLGVVRWVVVAILLCLPVWFLQYSAWGVVFSKTYTRLLIWFLAILGTAFFIERHSLQAWTWDATLAALVLTGASFVLVVPFGGVTSYPFALGWSEGNRLWDYSLAFASHLYRYPPSDPPAAYLEPGRQLVGALPFLLPHTSIALERMWLALLDVVPYLVLGLLAFRPSHSRRGATWVLAGIWGFTFLTQGPIHPPLLVCAILVALAWGGPLWLAVPLLIGSGYFAAISRFTWIFAPAIWAVMLEFGSAVSDRNRLPVGAWVRAAALGVAGLFGSVALPKLLPFLHVDLGIRSSATGAVAGGVSVSNVTNAASGQALLWYRLFPNATYGTGILLGLLVAAGPLITLLIFLSMRNWVLNIWQKLALILPSLAFLAVGLVISTKIGGGGDLHNLDMFLIGLLFAAALAWRAVGDEWIPSTSASRPWLRTVLVLAIAIPAFQPLMALRPISFASDEDWLVTLTDVARPKDLGSLPAEDAMASDLGKLRAAVGVAKTKGDVLFMDQRQLLTFGYIQDVELVPEYEKKQMMDEALSGNRAYFDAFYKDLATHRFSLIVSDPLRTPIRGSDYGFGEENDAWVKWVTKPVLCYYEEQDTLTNVHVELLAPRQIPIDCSGVLP